MEHGPALSMTSAARHRTVASQLQYLLARAVLTEEGLAGQLFQLENGCGRLWHTLPEGRRQLYRYKAKQVLNDATTQV